MVYLHTRRKGMQSNIEKPPDTDLEYKRKTNVAFCTTVDPITTKEGEFTQIYVDYYPSHQLEGINTSTSCMYMIVMSS